MALVDCDPELILMSKLVEITVLSLSIVEKDNF